MIDVECSHLLVFHIVFNTPFVRLLWVQVEMVNEFSEALRSGHDRWVKRGASRKTQTGEPRVFSEAERGPSRPGRMNESCGVWEGFGKVLDELLWVRTDVQRGW